MKRGVCFVFFCVFFVSFVSADLFDLVNFSLSPFNASVTLAGPNNPPVLGFVPDRLFACQGERFFYTVNATDLDVGDSLVFDVVPQIEFFQTGDSEDDSGGFSFAEFLLTSAELQKSQVAENYSLRIEVTDGEAIARNFTNISVLETNDAPILQPIANQSVLLAGNPVITLVLDVNDTEDGNGTDGNLSFNTTFLLGTPLFNFSENGTVLFVPTSAAAGDYRVEVCAIDGGLPAGSLHPNVVSACGVDSVANKSACQIFNLTIEQQVVSVSSGGGGGGGGGGGSQRECSDGRDNDGDGLVDFPNDPGCSSPGDDFEEDACESDWVCAAWNECQSASDLLETGSVAGVDYRQLVEDCSDSGFGEEICGFQDRTCQDLSRCNQFDSEPALDQACHYSENPSCSDGIKNCHDGACEFLVDCGGPCGICPTCSDGVQNGGEQGVDCGGSCPRLCRVELPSLGLTIFSVVGILVVLGLVVVVVLKYLQISRLGKVVAR